MKPKIDCNPHNKNCKPGLSNAGGREVTANIREWPAGGRAKKRRSFGVSDRPGLRQHCSAFGRPFPWEFMIGYRPAVLLLTITGTLLIGSLAVLVSRAGESPQSLTAYRGSSPKLDGVLSPGEWEDATAFQGVQQWTPQFSPVTSDADLSLRGWVKHDGRRLYFAFDVTDDVLYGIDTPRWLPEENPTAHELSRRGFPWLGDEM